MSDTVKDDCCSAGSSSGTSKKSFVSGAGTGVNGSRSNIESGSDLVLRREPALTAGKAVRAAINFIDDGERFKRIEGEGM